MLRWPRVLSGAWGLAPVSEKRAITGTGWPLKALALDSARAWLLPTKLPAAHTPLAPERRWPANLPVVASSWSTRAVGSASVDALPPGPWAQAASRAVQATARAVRGRDVGAHVVSPFLLVKNACSA